MPDDDTAPDTPDAPPAPLPTAEMDALTSACPICAAVVLSATAHAAWHTTSTTPVED